ncbi:hypothetical protein P5654_014240 [Bacillus safensis]|uniref:hypothetical protein n=1 Tax=Bacillus safensis TaxID=561879 RepID=UPI00248202AE|nr:hypothetical protein [Bacillus safensis]MDI0190891.1 hypothetical protein [Bacillus safensis]
MEQQSFEKNTFNRQLGIIGSENCQAPTQSDQNLTQGSHYFLTEQTVPAGTTAESTRGVNAYLAVDGSSGGGGYWDPGDNKGTLYINFPEVTPLAGIKFFAKNDGVSDTNYNVEISSMNADGSWTPRGRRDIMVPSNADKTETIWINQGQYKLIKIDHVHLFNLPRRFLIHEVLIHKYI